MAKNEKTLETFSEKKSKMKQECAQESEVGNMVLKKSRMFSTRNATAVSFERNKKPLQFNKQNLISNLKTESKT